MWGAKPQRSTRMTNAHHCDRFHGIEHRSRSIAYRKDPFTLNGIADDLIYCSSFSTNQIRVTCENWLDMRRFDHLAHQQPTRANWSRVDMIDDRVGRTERAMPQKRFAMAKPYLHQVDCTRFCCTNPQSTTDRDCNFTLDRVAFILAKIGWRWNDHRFLRLVEIWFECFDVQQLWCDKSQTTNCL